MTQEELIKEIKSKLVKAKIDLISTNSKYRKKDIEKYIKNLEKALKSLEDK